MSTLSRSLIALTVAAIGLVAGVAQARNLGPEPGTVAGTFRGPSSSATPYVNPAARGWQVVSLLTVGDSPRSGNYPMVGIPDGLGAVAGRWDGEHRRFDNDRFMTVFMNHELGATLGAVRAHGSTGAFVSQWTIDVESLAVVSGLDLIRKVQTWDSAKGRFVEGTTQFSRFCSADLPGKRAFYDPRSGTGFNGLMFMNGEETGAEGRAFAHVASGREAGTTYQLPYLGRFSWENAVAHPDAGRKTIVVGLDDSTPGQVYVYVGNKQRQGNPVERAGLQYGKLYGVRVANTPAETGPLNGRFDLVDVSDRALGTGAALQTASVERGITEFARPEDGAWDTRDPRAFYFVVTGTNASARAVGLQSARLYKLTFDRLNDPAAGGTIELVVDRAELDGVDIDARPTGVAMFDNITVDADGQVLIQEDPGNDAYAAVVWKIDPSRPKFNAAGAINPAFASIVLTSDRARFAPATAPFNADEENSGVIEVTDLVRHARWADSYRRYYLGVMQAHYVTTPELVEGGQLYLFASPRRIADRRGDVDEDDDLRWSSNDRDDRHDDEDERR